jgi:hypothetical protein
VRIAIILFFILNFASCAKKPAEEREEAIDLAQTYLSDGKCKKAIDVLEGVGRDRSDGIYLQVLASAYACRAGFDERDFLSVEIQKIDSDPTDLMKSLTTFTLSPETEADSDDYADFKEALDILLNVDSAQPSQVRREAKYGVRRSGDMGTYALFLSLTQLGKFIHFYGNVNAAGAKGTGAASTNEQGATPSTCFIEYTQSDAITFLGLGGGSVCNDMAIDDGHPDMLFAPAATLVITKRRMCEGLMLITNIIDILNNMTLPSSSMGDLSQVTATVNTYKTAITTADPGLETLIETTSQATCETLVADPAEFDNLQYIYALLFESGLP